MKKKLVAKEVEECCKAGECCKDDCCKKSCSHHSDQGNAIYGLGVIGAFVYFFPQIVSFGICDYGNYKSIFWPAILVFEMLKFSSYKEVVSKQFIKSSLIWGFILWLIGYVLGFILFAVVPVSLIGWTIMPIGVVITLWVLLKKIKFEVKEQAIFMGVPLGND